MPHSLDPPGPLREEESLTNNLNQSARPVAELNIPPSALKPGLPETECETYLDNLTLKPQPPPQQQPHLPVSTDFSADPSALTVGPIARWVAARRESILSQMTEACLNQSLDALLARSLLMREDYELVVNKPTRTAKVRQLLDTCHRHSEDFCRVVVRKLQDNKQLGLQPYPAELSSPTTAPAPIPSAPPLSITYNQSPRNIY